MGKTRADYEHAARDLGIDPANLSWNELRKAVNANDSDPSDEIIDLEEVPSTGIGDAVETVAKATGLDKVAKAILGEDCGCQQRKEYLNHFKSYVMLIKGTMNAEIREQWAAFKKEQGNKKQISHEKLKWIVSIYNTVFQANVKGCSGCVPAKTAAHYIYRLNLVYGKELEAV